MLQRRRSIRRAYAQSVWRGARPPPTGSHAREWGDVQAAVYGAGAIGSLVGARLHEAGVSAQLSGREAQVRAIRATGLLLKGRDESRAAHLPAGTSLDGTPDIILL